MIDVVQQVVVLRSAPGVERKEVVIDVLHDLSVGPSRRHELPGIRELAVDPFPVLPIKADSAYSPTVVPLLVPISALR
jgi:hypothetical protein